MPTKNSVDERSAGGSYGSRTAIRVLLFDFDGTLWDPEPEIFRAYDEMFRDHQQRLDAAFWGARVGTIGFTLWPHLEALTGRSVDRTAADEQVRQRQAELLARLGPRAGVLSYLHEADVLGLPRGIVSNSTKDWVARYAPQSGVGDGWSVIETADGDRTKAKPRPNLYISALARINRIADEALAFEDSPAGIRAAKRAGIRCVAVPNKMTTSLDLSEADLLLESFEQMSLRQVLRVMNRKRGWTSRPAAAVGMRASSVTEAQ